jgi:ATP-dependent DNA helicase RecG
VLQYCSVPRSRAEIQAYLELKDREHFRKQQILLPMIETGQLLMTLPDKPTSPKQKFYSVTETLHQEQKGGSDG